jgi:hypothetical protein
MKQHSGVTDEMLLKHSPLRDDTWPRSVQTLRGGEGDLNLLRAALIASGAAISPEVDDPGLVSTSVAAAAARIESANPAS